MKNTCVKAQHRFVHRLLGVVLLGLLVWPCALRAQINSGTIAGFVSDPSGASIPDAAIVASDLATKTETRAVTLQDGNYLVNYLVPGTYQVQISKPGFITRVETNVEVTAGHTVRLDFKLTVGQVQQSVEVQANPVAVDTENSEEKYTFSSSTLDALPNIDRNPLFQLNLMPGASNGPSTGNYGTNGGEDGSAVGLTNPQLAAFGGMDANANTIYLEGIPAREPQNGYIGLVPPEDDIEELDVYTGKYDAEYGFSASGVINVVTKSGTNRFHGDAFEYVENDKLNAIPFFATSTTPFQRNQFGGSVGGPILKDKLFFFGDFQRTPDLQSGPVIASAPDALMYAGNFSELYEPSMGTDAAGNTYGQLYNPFTRVFDAQGNQVSVQPFPGNIIPQNLWDPVAANMAAAQVFGLANLPGLANNFYYLNDIRQYSNQGDGRIDYSLSNTTKMFFRYSALEATLENPPTVNPFIEQSANSDTYNQNMGWTLTHSFSTAQMNELRLGYNRTDVHTSNNTLGKQWNNLFGIPNGNPPGAGTETGLAEFVGVDPYSTLAQPDWIAFIVSNTISLSDSFTWVKGKHTFKFGAMFNHVEDTSADTIGGDDPRGGFYFSPSMTSYNGTAADFSFPAFLLGTPVESERTQFDYGFPYQTYWETGYFAQDDIHVSRTFSLNLGLRWEYWTLPVERFNRQSNWNTDTNVLQVASGSDRSPAVNPDSTDVEPRIGFAWSPDGKTSIRGGWGISYWQNYWGFSPNGVNNGGGGAQSLLTVLGATYPYYVRQEFLTPNSLTPTLTITANGLPTALAETNGQGGFLIPPGQFVRGVAHNWKNQKVQQYSLDFQRQLTSKLVVGVGYLGVYGGNDPVTININQAPPSPINGINYNLNRPLYSEYPNLFDIPISESIGSSSYNALTATARGTVAKNLVVFAAFAYSRTFSNGFNTNPLAISQYYGPTQADIPLIFSAQLEYQLPFGKGQSHFSDAGRALDAVIGGWGASAFITIHDGPPFTVLSPVSLLNNGQANRPNVVSGCNPNISNRSLGEWFNTACFVNDPIPGTYGNEGTNVVRADGLQQVNLSLFKNFNFAERLKLQFRADFQNLFNHPNYGLPDLTVGDPAMGAVTSATVNARIIQLGAKLSF
ncbi:MAG: carboxypeptidase regulatory-like domain-containing protein [Candidatus Acidiferrales bacterium]